MTNQRIAVWYCDLCMEDLQVGAKSDGCPDYKYGQVRAGTYFFKDCRTLP